MKIRIDIQTTGKGSVLATVCSITPEETAWHRVTLRKGQNPAALHRQLQDVTLAMLERAAGLMGKPVELRVERQGR